LELNRKFWRLITFLCSRSSLPVLSDTYLPCVHIWGKLNTNFHVSLAFIICQRDNKCCCCYKAEQAVISKIVYVCTIEWYTQFILIYLFIEVKCTHILKHAVCILCALLINRKIVNLWEFSVYFTLDRALSMCKFSGKLPFTFWWAICICQSLHRNINFLVSEEDVSSSVPIRLEILKIKAS
jgi:hypothetical protein